MQRRRLAAAAAGVTVAAGAVAVAGATGAVAQDEPAGGAAPPTVTVDLTAKKVTLGGATELAAGPTRFEFTNAGRGERYGTIARLAEGRDVADLRAFMRRSGPAAPPPSLASVVAGSATVPEGASRALTLRLDPDATYVVLDTTGQRAARWPATAFTTSAGGNGARAAAPDARVRMIDFGFKGSSTLPREGVVRFSSTGRSPHFTVAFPLRRGTSTRAAIKTVRANDEQGLERFIGGPPMDVQGLVTQGAVNDQEVAFPQAGRYLLVCFMSNGPKAPGHHELGMVRAVTVR